MTSEEKGRHERITRMHVASLNELQEFFELEVPALRWLMNHTQEHILAWDLIKRQVNRAVLIRDLKAAMNLQHLLDMVKTAKREFKFGLASIEQPQHQEDPDAVAKIGALFTELDQLHVASQDAVAAAGSRVDTSIRPDEI